MALMPLVTLDLADHIATVTMRRTDRLNSLNTQMIGELQAALEEGAAAARVVVFREIESAHGHDGFLIDFPKLADILGPFIETVTIKSRPWYQKRFSASRMAYYGAVMPADREFTSLDRTGAFP